jgi:predicted dehydrogenase
MKSGKNIVFVGLQKCSCIGLLTHSQSLLDNRNPFLVSLNVRAPFTPDNKYLNTPWRKDPSWYGGLFIDAFVHASAMLRMVFGDATMVSAITSSQADFLPGVDTMVAHVQWKKENGAGNDIQGSISVTYACTMPKFELDVTGTDGTVLLQRKLNGPGYQLSVNKGPAEEFNFGGIDAEFLGFAAACRNQQSDDINTPEEAIKDLAFVEACLESGKNNGAFTKVAI